MLMIPGVLSLPWLLPHARAILTNHSGAIQRFNLPGLNLKDGKLNNGTLIAAAAAIDVIWGGSIRTPVSRTRGVDFILLDMQRKPFRDTFDAAEKAGKGVFVQAKAGSAEVAKLVRGGKDANLAELLNSGRGAWPPIHCWRQRR